MRHWLNVGFLLAHRLRRWPNSKPTLGQRLMLARWRTHNERRLTPVFLRFFCMVFSTSFSLADSCWVSITSSTYSSSIMCSKCREPEKNIYQKMTIDSTEKLWSNICVLFNFTFLYKVIFVSFYSVKLLFIIMMVFARLKLWNIYILAK